MEEIIKLPYIYTPGKYHKLKLIDIKNKIYVFEPLEDWMSFRIIYQPNGKDIFGVDTDGLGCPIYVGDYLDDMKVKEIYYNENKINIKFD